MLHYTMAAGICRNWQHTSNNAVLPVVQHDVWTWLYQSCCSIRFQGPIGVKTLQIDPPVCQQLESERAGDVVGDVGHTEVKVGQVDLHEVTMDDLQLLLVGRALDTARQLQHLATVNT